MRRAHGGRQGLRAGAAGVILAGATAVAVLVPSPSAFASVFTVTRLDDPVPGGCTPADCSLREAIIDANAMPGGPHTIDLSAGTYVIERAPGAGDDEDHGDFDISASMTIEGEGTGAGGTTIDARPNLQSAALDRVFQVHSGTVVFDGLKITGGDSSASSTDFGGGGVAVQLGADVTLREVAVEANRGSAAGPILTNDGGGVLVDRATLRVEDSTIEDNVVEHASVASGGGIGVLPNGASVVTIDGSVIKGNRAATTGSGSVASGGALSVGQATVTITDTTIEGNEARTTGSLSSEAAGGGISLLAGSVTVEATTVNGNTAVGTAATAIAHGGGAVLAAGSLTVKNSTISGNTADAPAAAQGGGVNSAATVDVVFSTIAANDATEGGGAYRTSAAADFRLKGALVAGNVGGDCGGSAMSSQGYNLDSDNSCDLGQATDLPSADAVLQTLAANGGPTRTHALGTGSDALDQGGACTGTVTVDQRRVARPQSSACDIGAFELEVAPPPTTTTTTTTTTTAPTSTTTTTTPSNTTTTTTTTNPEATTTTSAPAPSSTTTTAPRSSTTDPTGTSASPGDSGSEGERDRTEGVRRKGAAPSFDIGLATADDHQALVAAATGRRRGYGGDLFDRVAIGLLWFVSLGVILFPILARRWRRDDEEEEEEGPAAPLAGAS